MKPNKPSLSLPLVIAATLVGSAQTFAQAPPAAAQRATQTPQAAATVDLLGDWVSVVTGDWKYRMVTPSKGVLDGLPLNAEGRRIAMAWDPKQDVAAGEQCRPFGAGNIMRVPGRLRIKWEGGDTLRIDTDAGTQTRLFRFGSAAKAGEPSWQGTTHAEWHKPTGPAAAGTGGSLKAVTTGLRTGYLRWNGAPYSDATVLTEYFERQTAPNGDSWLIVTQIVKDPKYLSRPYVTSANFKKVKDGEGWNPTPCVTAPGTGK